jgi:hypothetical protein
MIDWLENSPSSITSYIFATVGLSSSGIVMEDVDWGVVSSTNGEQRRGECGEVVANWFIATTMIKKEIRVDCA